MRFEEAILDILQHFDKTDEVIAEISADKYLSWIRKSYPVSLRNIHWCEVPGAVEAVADSCNHAVAFAAFVKRMANDYGLSGRVVLISNGPVEIALRMPLVTLIDKLSLVLKTPQHCYLIAEDGSWCMNLAFDGDMAFGFRPLHLNRGVSSYSQQAGVGQGLSFWH